MAPFRFLVLLVQIVCKDIFIILKLVVYGIYINSSTFYPVKHKIAVPYETDSTVSVLFQLGMGTNVIKLS